MYCACAFTCPHPREIKKDILSRDRDLRLAQYEGRTDMSTWKGPLAGPDYGTLCWTMAQSALMASETCESDYVSTPCFVCMPLCKEEDISRDSLLSHVLTTHSRSPCNSDELLSLLSSVPDSDSVLFNYLCSLANLF